MVVLAQSSPRWRQAQEGTAAATSLRLAVMVLVVLVMMMLEAAVAGASSSAVGGGGGYTAEALADEVVQLPGTEALDIKFRQFSGYVDVGNTVSLHYWFVEAQQNPDNAPLVLWTNGGPGCSGLLGFFTEMGPFRPDVGGERLTINPYSWNKYANMLFIEAPVGVGFSYAEDPEQYRIGDTKTAIDNYKLIQGFLDRFPQYRSNALILASESYGGHYMPTLTHRLLHEQAKLNSTDPHKLKFRGFLVGNPFTSWVNNWKATYEAFWGHQLVSLPSYSLYRRTCAHIRDSLDYVDACMALAARLNEEIGRLNPYALDYPVCTDTTDSSSSSSNKAAAAKAGRAQRAWLLHHASEAHHPDHSDRDDTTTQQERRRRLSSSGIIDVADYQPCEDNYLVQYLNRADVKSSIHVKAELNWTECSTITKYERRDLLLPMEHYYSHFIDNKDKYGGIDILVYSGDDDSVCATWGTQEWIWGLGYQVAGAKWQAWSDTDNQVAGYVTQFEGRLSFVTVHGAGHEVPTYMPAAALELFEAYLNGTWFDTHHQFA